MTEAIPLPATALVSSALAIVAGVAPARQVLAPYADPVIFLFLGSFLLAEALTPLRPPRPPRRRACSAGASSAAGPRAAWPRSARPRPRISTCLSNTATAALMTPIALGALAAPRGSAEPR